MIWFIWVLSFVIQLHYLEANPWFGLSWPLFMTFTLVLTKYQNIYRLIWGIILFGVVADLSSHMPRGEVFGSYLVLLLGVWLINFSRQKYDDKLMQRIWLISSLAITFAYQLLINFGYLSWTQYTAVVISIWLVMATTSLILLDWAVFRLNKSAQNKSSEIYQ